MGSDPAPQAIDTPAASVLKPWPADLVERWPLDRIKPYPANVLQHTPDQVAQIAASMERFGVTAPVLVDEAGVLIYGHGRRLAAELLGFDELPVSVAHGWSEDEKRAYRIADNQLGRIAEWDMPALSSELKALQLADFNMPLLGFPDLKLVEFIAGVGGGQAPAETPAEPAAERELTPDEKALMIGVWQQLAGEWLAIIEKQEQLSTNYTRGALAAHFLRARFYGAEVPSAATLAYNPHRATIVGDVGEAAGSLLDGLREARTNEGGIIERLWYVMNGQPRLDKMLAGILPFLKRRMPADFPSALARALIDEFITEPGGRVLDPCHGWGGRMLGFLLADNAELYAGFDPDQRTSAGVQAMFHDLSPLAEGPKSCRLAAEPFEDAKLPPRTLFDFALTSPPYFDVEKYGGEASSWRRYATFEAWVEGFYWPMIVKVGKALKPGGVFALQVGNQTYPLERTAAAIAPSAGFDHAETRATGMINNRTKTEEADGEIILILRKRLIETGKSNVAPASADPALQFGKLL